MTNEMTAEEAVKQIKENCYFASISEKTKQALDKAVKALESKPMEKFDDVKTHIQRLAGDYKCWDNRLTWEEALELNRMLEAQPNSNEFFNFDAPMVKKSDAVSREEVQDLISRWLSDYLLDETREALETINYKIGDMPSVIPQRKVGKWIATGVDGEFECSCCQNLWQDAEENTYDDWIHIAKFCPCCGAEMGGTDDDREQE